MWSRNSKNRNNDRKRPQQNDQRKKTKQLMNWDDDQHKRQKKQHRSVCQESKQKEKNSSMAHDLIRDYRNPNNTKRCCIFVSFVSFVIVTVCPSLSVSLYVFDYQPTIKTFILSHLIACSHLILCCRRCVLSLAYDRIGTWRKRSAFVFILSLSVWVFLFFRFVYFFHQVFLPFSWIK